MYFNCIIFETYRGFDRLYTYFSREDVVIGQRVIVPFGKKDRPMEAVVDSLCLEVPDIQTKEVLSIHDVIFDSKMLRVFEKLSFELFLSKADIYRLFFQKNRRFSIKADDVSNGYKIVPNNPVRFTKYYHLLLNGEKLDDYLKRNARNKSIQKLLLYFKGIKIPTERPKGVRKATIERLLDDKVIDFFELPVYESKKIENIENAQLIQSLRKNQEEAFNQLRDKSAKKKLLFGDTGSGKTELCIQYAKKIAASGKKVIFIVPNHLQLIDAYRRLKPVFKEDMAIISSVMSDKVRHSESRRIANGDYVCLVGTYAALYEAIDYEQIGVLVLDECDDPSYYTVQPRFDIRVFIEIVQNEYSFELVYVSATPNVKQYLDQSFTKIKIMREDSSKKNNVVLADMKEELKKGNKSYLSITLQEHIQTALRNKGKVLLLLNRTGYSSFVSCRNCGNIIVCPNCNEILQQNDQQLLCLHCGYHSPKFSNCPACGSRYIKRFYVGIDLLREDLQKLFPNAKVALLQASELNTQDDIVQISKIVTDDSYDILIGTELITRSFHMQYDVLGVVAIDPLMFSSSGEGLERAFSMLSHFAGRSFKRGEIPLIVQTYHPQLSLFKDIQDNAYERFIQEEIQFRKRSARYPFYRRIKIQVHQKHQEDLLAFTILKKDNVYLSDYIPTALEKTYIVISFEQSDYTKIIRKIHQIIDQKRDLFEIEVLE